MTHITVKSVETQPIYVDVTVHHDAIGNSVEQPASTPTSNLPT